MLRLILSILLLCPAAIFGQTITMPAETVATGKYVLVQPVFDPPGKVVDAKYVVLGLKEKPRFYSIPTIKEAILLERPSEGDEITVVVSALFDGGKMANMAVTTIKGSGQSLPPVTTPAPPATPAANIPATGIHVIMVVDINNTPSAISSLAVGDNAITANMASRQGKGYVRNSTDSLLNPWRNSISGKQLPVLLVIDSATRKEVLAESFVPSGDVNQVAQAIIQRVTPK